MTSLLPSDAELAQIRADLNAATLPDTGNILSQTWVSDGAGGGSATWGTATANVSYRLDWRQGRQQVQSGAVEPFAFWQLTLPHGTGITSANRFEDKSGNQYNVSSVDNGKSWSMDVRCTVEAL
jgi:Phage head-tail joining protein